MDIRWKWLEERGFHVLSDHDQYAYMQSLWAPTETVQAVFCDAPAATGKTTLATLAGAYEVEKGTYDRLIYIRNAVAVRDLGFLPGDLAERTAPYMAPFVDALDKVRPGTFEKWSRSQLGDKQPKIHAVTTSYLRGVTFDRSFVIVDEAQSFDLTELQTVLTRLTDTCKVVVIGSKLQNDNQKQRRTSGLTPFELYMRHYEGKPVTFHKLSTNYRGWFSQHADTIGNTVAALEQEAK